MLIFNFDLFEIVKKNLWHFLFIIKIPLIAKNMTKL